MTDEAPKLEAVVEFADNPEPRCPCVLLLDTSGSMQGEPIRLLNEGLRALRDALASDDKAQKRIELAIVTFGSRVEVREGFVTADRFDPPELQAGGDTPMGAGILQALELLETRKAAYKSAGVAYYRPWVFMITDGEPTDSVEAAGRRVHDAETGHHVAFFAVGVQGANVSKLAQIVVRAPVMLRGLDFREMFLWLSTSMARVAHSKMGDQIQLPPASGWTQV